MEKKKKKPTLPLNSVGGCCGFWFFSEMQTRILIEQFECYIENLQNETETFPEKLSKIRFFHA